MTALTLFIADHTQFQSNLTTRFGDHCQVSSNVHVHSSIAHVQNNCRYLVVAPTPPNYDSDNVQCRVHIGYMQNIQNQGESVPL
jgi:hypothetical protein